MIDLVIALRAVTSAFEAAGAEFVVVGSGAAAAWGAARSTRDIDVAVVLNTPAFESLRAKLGNDAFYIPEVQARQASAATGSFSVLHLPTGGKVDVFVVSPDDEFETTRRSRRVRADVLGHTTWVASAEDVVLAKLVWRRESRSELQWRDCGEIVAVNQLDTAYLRRWASTLGVADDLEELLGLPRAT